MKIKGRKVQAARRASVGGAAGPLVIHLHRHLLRGAGGHRLGRGPGWVLLPTDHLLPLVEVVPRTDRATTLLTRALGWPHAGPPSCGGSTQGFGGSADSAGNLLARLPFASLIGNGSLMSQESLKPPKPGGGVQVPDGKGRRPARLS